MSIPGVQQAMAFVQVADRDRGRAFYRDTLGLRLAQSDEHGDAFDLDGATLRLTAIAGYQPGPHPALGWVVADIAAAVRSLTEKGIRFSVYEGMGQDELGIWRSPDGSAQVAWFQDPDGNVLSLAQL